ncbi:MAG: aldo/keto reductase [Eubacteriales bacterium]|nr:aldo/keto reductase [Eubacteriales bacterium]
MKYRALGKTGMMVSEIGFGGEHADQTPYENVAAILDTAIAGGVNIMDAFMSGPEIRDNLGRALQGRRKDMIVQGHIGAVQRDGQYARSRDVAECDLFIKDFLTRLRTDYIDLGMLHFVDTQEDFDAVFHSPLIDYALKLKKDGVIRALGVSSHSCAIAAKMVETGLLDCMLFSTNPAFDLVGGVDMIFDPKPFTGELNIDPERLRLYRLCEEKGVGITVMKTLGAGRLLSAEASPFGVALTPVQCAHYALTRPAVASVLIGAKTPAEMEAALAYCSASDEEKDYSVIARNNPLSMQGHCMYCNHCLPCPVGIDVAAVTKYLDMAREVGVSPTLKAHYDAQSAHGGDCISCGSCESNCPFGVSVRENMAACRDVFGK